MIHTMMACTNPRVTHLDGAISRRLRAQPTLSLHQEKGSEYLRLHTPDGDTLDFIGQPTP